MTHVRFAAVPCLGFGSTQLMIATKAKHLRGNKKKRRSIMRTLALALLCVTLPLRADEQEGGKKCSNATLKGDYGLHATGIRAARPPAGMGQPEMHATIAL